MCRASLVSIAIVAIITGFCILVGAALLGGSGSSLGALVGIVLGVTVAARYLVDMMAIARARRDPARALQRAKFESDQQIERLRHRRSWRSLRSTWGITRLLRQDDKDRRALEENPAAKRLYSQRHHDLDIRDIPGAAHLARKRKRKR